MDEIVEGAYWSVRTRVLCSNAWVIGGMRWERGCRSIVLICLRLCWCKLVGHWSRHFFSVTTWYKLFPYAFQTNDDQIPRCVSYSPYSIWERANTNQYQHWCVASGYDVGLGSEWGCAFGCSLAMWWGRHWVHAQSMSHCGLNYTIEGYCWM